MVTRFVGKIKNLYLQITEFFKAINIIIDWVENEEKDKNQNRD